MFFSLLTTKGSRYLMAEVFDIINVTGYRLEKQRILGAIDAGFIP
jgi:serine/threonine protein kinase HipA of HipAB toxin-antitoxin module